MRAGKVRYALTHDELAALESVSALAPEYPEGMIERQAAGREPSAR